MELTTRWKAALQETCQITDQAAELRNRIERSRDPRLQSLEIDGITVTEMYRQVEELCTQVQNHILDTNRAFEAQLKQYPELIRTFLEDQIREGQVPGLRENEDELLRGLRLLRNMIEVCQKSLDELEGGD